MLRRHVVRLDRLVPSSFRSVRTRVRPSSAKNLSDPRPVAESSVSRDTQPQKFRSKHYDPSSDKPVSEKKLLEPHVLSQRLKKLCDSGKLESAVAMVKSAPRDAQNTPVWNTLIWECMKAERYQLGYQLYTDMKRRGHSPTTRTFSTILNGLARIESWPSHPKQLKNAHLLYEHFQRHVDLVKRTDPTSPELVTNPISAYVRILGDAGLHQQIFDVYYGLDTEGRMAPDILLYTAFFQALSAMPNEETGWIQNASSAKLLWNFMLKASKKRKLQLDDFVISSAILAMSRGRSADQNFAFEIAAEYFGLTGPGEPSKMASVPLKSQSFGAILTACRYSEKHAEAVHFFQLVLQRPPALGGPAIIDRPHVEEVLSSYIALSISNAGTMSLELLEWMLREEITRPSRLDAKKIRPTFSTFNYVLTASWRSNDWRSACKTFDLMTGYHIHDFMDGVVSENPRLDVRSTGRNIPPTAETMSTMVRTALGSENPSNIRQALRLVHYIGFRKLTQSTAPDGQLESSRTKRNRYFYVTKLAQAVDDAAAFLKANGGPKSMNRPDDLEKWSQLKAEARMITGKVNDDGFLPTAVKERRDTKGIARSRKQTGKGFHRQ